MQKSWNSEIQKFNSLYQCSIFIHWSFRRIWNTRSMLYCISSCVVPRISMSDTLVARQPSVCVIKICDFRNQDFDILIPTYASLKLFFYCLGWYLSNGIQVIWIPTWLQNWGTKVVRTKLLQRNCCFCNVLQGQYNGTSCWQPISFLTTDQCWSRCWNLQTSLLRSKGKW